VFEQHEAIVASQLRRTFEGTKSLPGASHEFAVPRQVWVCACREVKATRPSLPQPKLRNTNLNTPVAGLRVLGGIYPVHPFPARHRTDSTHDHCWQPRLGHPARRIAGDARPSLRAAISLSLTVLGVSGLLGIWIAGLTVDSHPRRSLLITTAAIAVSMLLLPFVGGSLPLALALMTVWGAGLGAIGIYNQSAILRAGRENKDAANGLTVLTIQLGITIGALYGSAALVVAGPLLVPAAAALPVIAALLVTLGGRKAAYPPGPRESVWKSPRPIEERAGTR
jgi:MFS family permease